MSRYRQHVQLQPNSFSIIQIEQSCPPKQPHYLLSNNLGTISENNMFQKGEAADGLVGINVRFKLNFDFLPKTLRAKGNKLHFCNSFVYVKV